MAKITITKQFENREQLDAHIRNTYGENKDINREITFEGTKEELDKLSLSEDNSVYGVKVKLLINK